MDTSSSAISLISLKVDTHHLADELKHNLYNHIQINKIYTKLVVLSKAEQACYEHQLLSDASIDQDQSNTLVLIHA